MKCKHCNQEIKNTKEKDIEIFEADTVKEALKNCLEAGYFPADIEEVYRFKEEGTIPKDKGYDTSTLWYKGKLRKAMLQELKNIEEIYKEKGRLLFLGGTYSSDLGGSDDLDLGGCFCGVKVKSGKK